MAKAKRIEFLQPDSEPKVQEAAMLLKKKNVKYRPLPKFKSGCKDC